MDLHVFLLMRIHTNKCLVTFLIQTNNAVFHMVEDEDASCSWLKHHNSKVHFIQKH